MLNNNFSLLPSFLITVNGNSFSLSQPHNLPITMKLKNEILMLFESLRALMVYHLSERAGENKIISVDFSALFVFS